VCMFPSISEMKLAWQEGKKRYISKTIIFST
jgi:hypothetical protein